MTVPTTPTESATEFISEPLAAETATADTTRMARGEPGLPKVFTWRKQAYRVTGVLGNWKESGACRNGSPEMYLRKHWYELTVTSESEPEAAAQTWKIYFDRQARGKAAARWWLYTRIV